MSLTTRNPTSNTNPDDSGQGGSAVTGASNTGHDSTVTSQSGAGTTTKSCKWSGFAAAPAGVIVSNTLRFNWSEDGSIVNAGTSSFRVQYSLDGGSNWTTAFLHADVTSPTTSSTQVTLSNSQDLTLVQVRDRMQAIGGDVGDSASITTSISSIRIEVVTQDNQVIVMM